MKIRLNQRGISLIEILVVLVLLLVGILSVIRLFPPGFLINKNMEAATEGTRLAKQAIDWWTNNAANLPDAIVPIRPVVNGNTYAFQIDLDATPDDLSASNAPVQGADPYYYSDVDKQRRVLGERVRIPIPSPTTAGRGSVYMLSSGPVFYLPFTQGGSTASIFITGAPLFRSVQDYNANPTGPNLFGPSQYAIDEENLKVGFLPAAFPRKYLASYSYYDASNRVQTVVDQPIPKPGVFPGDMIPANFTGWLDFDVPQPNNGLVPDSEVVARAFNDLTAPGNAGTPSQAFSPNDPYEFYMASGMEGSFANVGVVVFNPRGYDYQEQGPTGNQPLTARIDYDVLDWHIIHEDRPMPASGPYQVRLSLKGIKKLGDFESDQSQYIGIFRDSTIPAGSQKDMLIYNVSTGQIVPATDTQRNQPNYYVNFKEGIVTFNDFFGDNNRSGTFRFFYKAHGDWALQIQKASGLYREHNPNPPASASNVGLSEYYVGVSNQGDGPHPRLYFPPMDAGKTVSIRELLYTDAGGRMHRVTNESYRLAANRSQFENINGRTLTWIDLRDKHKDATGWDFASRGQAVSGVEGVSFRARVLWHTGTAVNETDTGNAERIRWHRIDTDTFLTRTAGQ